MARNIKKVLDEYFTIQAEMDKLQARQNELKSELKAVLEDNNLRGLKNAKYQIQLVDGRRTDVDTRAFKELYPELAATLMKTSTYTSFRVVRR